MEETKTCDTCNQKVPLVELSISYASRCKKCHSKIVRTAQIKIQTEDPFEWAFRAKRSNCKSRDIYFDLSRDYLEELWIKQGGLCAALKIPMDIHCNNRSDAKATLDRINPALGYTEGNVSWLSWLANRVKNDCTDPSVFMNVAEYVRSHNQDKEPQFDFRFPS